MGSKELLRMATALDEMTRSVLSDEAELLDQVLKKLKAKKFVAERDAEALRKLYQKYLTPRDSEESIPVDAELGDSEDEEIEE